MAIVLPLERPAIDVVDGSYERPEEPWSHLGDPEPRARLEAAIAAVGRLESDEASLLPFLGTAFAVGPDLVLGFAGRPLGGDASARLHASAVDFGLELSPMKSVRVEVEDLVYADDRWGVQILKARLPKTMKPLRLSVLDPEALIDREVVLLGYPSSDARNDPALVQQIFRGVLDVKRLLPGRIRDRDTTDDERPVLVHDCASTGGCGGGPLVDVTTGDVVGVHFAGFYLEANHAAPAWELARDATLVGTGVLFAGPVPTNAPALAETAPPLSAEAAALEQPAERVAAEEEADAEADDDRPVQEIAEGRPALLVEGWPAGDGPWRPLLMPHQQRLDSAVHAVGKVLTGKGPDGWSGTAFLVGDRLAMTASFVAQEFAEGAGLGASIRSGRKPSVDFGEALALSAGTATAAVTGVRFIHPYFHVAVLELDRMPEGVVTLELAARLPSQLSGRLVAVLSFGSEVFAEPAAERGAQESAYRKHPGRMFIQPGTAVQVGHIPDEAALPALVHDCATGGGSAGGPVIDLGTGYVIGVHTHGRSLEGGFAQPTWELARDPIVWDCPIGFRPDPRPPWLDRWEEVGAGPSAPVEPVAGARTLRWTVDDVPIDWAREEPRALERLLVETVDAQMALYVAENVGLPLGMVSRGAQSQILWRQLLKTAATAGLLRRLLEQFLADPQHAGIAPMLRSYL